jgi:acyl carrier protein
MTSQRHLDWEAFARAVADVARVPAAQVGPETRLLEDLNLDSLALAELIVLLTVDLGMSKLEAELGTREWERVSLRQLFDEYQRGERPARGKQYVIRERRPS